MTKAVFQWKGDSVPLRRYLLNTYLVSGIEPSDTAGVLRYVSHGTYPQEMFSPPRGTDLLGPDGR